MTIVLDQFKQSLEELDPLLTIVGMASTNDPHYSYTRIGPGIVPPATAGVVVLLVGRFEQFLKDISELALDQYGKAVPPVNRLQLPIDLQLRIIRENLTSAAKETIFGSRRPPAARVSELHAVANKIVSGEIWGDHAIQTSGNPGRETVKGLLQLIGQITDPWSQIETIFQPSWSARQSSDPSRKSIPRASAELESVLVWRNSVAHSASSLPLGLGDLLDARFFLEDLATSVESVTCTAIDSIVTSIGSSPPTWP